MEQGPTSGHPCGRHLHSRRDCHPHEVQYTSLDAQLCRRLQASLLCGDGQGGQFRAEEPSAGRLYDRGMARKTWQIHPENLRGPWRHKGIGVRVQVHSRPLSFVPSALMAKTTSRNTDSLERDLLSVDTER